MGKSLIIPGADFSANSITDNIIINDLFDSYQTPGYFLSTTEDDYVLFTNTKLKSNVYSLQISLQNPISFNNPIFNGHNQLIIQPKDDFKLFTATGFMDQNAVWNEGSSMHNTWGFIENPDKAIISIQPNKFLSMFVSITQTAEDDMSMYILSDIINIELI